MKNYRKYMTMTMYFYGGGAIFHQRPSNQSYITLDPNQPLKPHDGPVDLTKLLFELSMAQAPSDTFNPVRVRDAGEAEKLVRAITNHYSLRSSMRAIGSSRMFRKMSMQPYEHL